MLEGLVNTLGRYPVPQLGDEALNVSRFVILNVVQGSLRAKVWSLTQLYYIDLFTTVYLLCPRNLSVHIPGVTKCITKFLKL